VSGALRHLENFLKIISNSTVIMNKVESCIKPENIKKELETLISSGKKGNTYYWATYWWED